MSTECVCEVLPQNILQIMFYSLLKLPLLGYEPKRAIFVSFPLNANELLFPDPFQKRAELQELKLRDTNKHEYKPVIFTENVLGLKVSHLIVLCLINYCL